MEIFLNLFNQLLSQFRREIIRVDKIFMPPNNCSLIGLFCIRIVQVKIRLDKLIFYDTQYLNL